MTDEGVVVDASAVLALLQGESFGKVDPELVVGAWISTVNLSEVLAKLHAAELSGDEADRAVASLTFRVVVFDEVHARNAARLWPATRRTGLSFGDRACLATAMLLGVPALTADKAWAKLDVGASVVLIR